MAAASFESDIIFFDFQKVGVLYLQQGNAESALEYLGVCADNLSRFSSTPGLEERHSIDRKNLDLAKTLKYLANAHLLLGEVQEAVTILARAASHCNKAGRDWANVATFSPASIEIYTLISTCICGAAACA
uniref:MalT-like TPR region domain-containing protein n=1 Tax=Pseudictyota dubia TaxID=2749911 RepID=A0A7R9VFD9_9STRA